MEPADHLAGQGPPVNDLVNDPMEHPLNDPRKRQPLNDHSSSLGNDL